jgi:malonyl-CoA O-methyltransferase
MQAWRAALSSEGFVLFSTIGPGSLGLLRALYAEAGWGPAHAPLVDMHDLGDMLVESGFADPVMDQETLRLDYGSAETLLAELRELGGNLAPQRFPGCRTPRWRAALIEGLSRRAAADGRIPLEIELVYGHAFRAPDRGPLISDNTRIDLDDMKLMLRNSGSRK